MSDILDTLPGGISQKTAKRVLGRIEAKPTADPDLTPVEMVTSSTRCTCEECGEEFTKTVFVLAGANYAEPSMLCEACGDNAIAAKSRAEHERLAEERWSAVPEEYRNTDLEHPDYVAQMATRHLAQMWFAGDPVGDQPHKTFLGLIGASGLCKSRIASQMARRWIWEGHRVDWVNAIEWQDAVQDRNAKGSADLLQATLKSPYLFLDDLGTLDGTDVIARRLYRVLEHRSSHRLPTVWTANEQLDEMLAELGEDSHRRKKCLGRLADYSNIIEL